MTLTTNMPASHVRQVLESIASKPSGLTDERDAVALLALNLGEIEAADRSDGLAHLTKVRDAARKALDATFKVRSTSALARSHADLLVTALAPLEDVIDELQSGVLPEQDAITRLSLAIAEIQAAPHTQELARLLKLRANAERVMKNTEAVARGSKVVASHREVLAQALPPLVRLITARQQEEARQVEATRKASQEEGGRIQAAMTQLTRQDPVDLVKLRALTEREHARASALDNELKRAAFLQLPIAPPPAKVAFADNRNPQAAAWTADVCARAFAKYTWFDFKALRKSREPVTVPGLAEPSVVTDDVMWKLYQYRRQVIDQLIAQLHAEFPDSQLMFKSSGSEDIESDLDITVASVAPGDDVRAMTRFNAEIKRQFGRPPGRVFDTNLYARDYRAIEDNMSRGRGAPPRDRDIDEPTGEMVKMGGIDQDVATLMKQRRFLDEETFATMAQMLAASMSTDEDEALIQQRFEEAESVYLLTTQQKVQAIAARIDAMLAERGAVASKDPAVLAYREAKSNFQAAVQQHDMVAVQLLMPEFLDLLEEGFPDEVMEVTDEQYAERMAALREDQALLAKSEREHAQEDGSCADAHPGKTHAKWAEELNALKARIKQAQFTNIVFANEAYMSEGAITHIVAGAQASTPEKKQAVLAKIQPAELLQSTNEQLADFFKDMKHMAHAEHDAGHDPVAVRRATGEAFVHASKYLSRMLDGAAMLQEKYADDETISRMLSEPPFELCRRAGVAKPRELQKKVETQLVKLRKSATIPGDAKAELAVADVQALFQVGSIAELRELITAFSIDFNQRVRQLPSFQAAQQVSRGTEQAYFSPATRVPADPAR